MSDPISNTPEVPEPLASVLKDPKVNVEINETAAPEELGNVFKSNFNQTEGFTTNGDYVWDPTLEVISLPSASFNATLKALNNAPESTVGKDPKSLEWQYVVRQGVRNATYDEGFEDTVNRDGADFVQFVEVNGQKLKSANKRPPHQPGTKPTSEALLNIMRSGLGLGVPFAVPLWHSGFWIEMNPPKESELLELYRIIVAEKITLGRSTYGLMFSNTTSYTTRALLDFAMDHFRSSSVTIKEGQTLQSMIDVRDYPLLVYGIAHAIWPNGFQYQRACIADAEKCKHVVKEKLSLSKLQIVDSNALSTHQKLHMTKRMTNSVDFESLIRYKSEFIRGQDLVVSIGDKMKVTLKMPSVLEHIDAGYRWINGIEESYSTALTMEENKRDDYLLSQGKATTMRQYTHFIKSIQVGEEEATEINDIEELLDSLSSMDKTRDELMDKIKKFIDDSMVSIIAIPTYTCPACGKAQKDKKELKQFPDLIALDVASVFFTLLAQRTQRIDKR